MGLREFLEYDATLEEIARKVASGEIEEGEGRRQDILIRQAQVETEQFGGGDPKRADSLDSPQTSLAGLLRVEDKDIRGMAGGGQLSLGLPGQAIASPSTNRDSFNARVARYISEGALTQEGTTQETQDKIVGKSREEGGTGGKSTSLGSLLKFDPSAKSFSGQGEFFGSGATMQEAKTQRAARVTMKEEGIPDEGAGLFTQLPAGSGVAISEHGFAAGVPSEMEQDQIDEERFGKVFEAPETSQLANTVQDALEDYEDRYGEDRYALLASQHVEEGGDMLEFQVAWDAKKKSFLEGMPTDLKTLQKWSTAIMLGATKEELKKSVLPSNGAVKQEQKLAQLRLSGLLREREDLRGAIQDERMPDRRLELEGQMKLLEDRISGAKQSPAISEVDEYFGLVGL